MKLELSQKLTLRKETLRDLSTSELSAVVAGAGTLTSVPVSRITCQSSCCDTLTTITAGVTCAGNGEN